MQFLIYVKWPVMFTVIIQQSAKLKKVKVYMVKKKKQFTLYPH